HSMRNDMSERIARRKGGIEMDRIGISRKSCEQFDIVKPEDANLRGAFASRDLIEGAICKKLLVQGSPLQHVGSWCVAERLETSVCRSDGRWRNLFRRGLAVEPIPPGLPPRAFACPSRSDPFIRPKTDIAMLLQHDPIMASGMPRLA